MSTLDAVRLCSVLEKVSANKSTYSVSVAYKLHRAINTLNEFVSFVGELIDNSGDEERLMAVMGGVVDLDLPEISVGELCESDIKAITAEEAGLLDRLLWDMAD
ncbi:MAG: hypothetical protein J6Y37_07035 [Paludibacteraceae bacterium]|nr:hypothetical protein [Paludibacteraceae bacterium]